MLVQSDFCFKPMLDRNMDRNFFTSIYVIKINEVQGIIKRREHDLMFLDKTEKNGIT